MMTKDELKKLDIAALEREVESLKEEQFKLKFSVVTGQIKDSSQFKKLRATIARSLTFLREKQSVQNNNENA